MERFLIVYHYNYLLLYFISIIELYGIIRLYLLFRFFVKKKSNNMLISNQMVFGGIAIAGFILNNKIASYCSFQTFFLLFHMCLLLTIFSFFWDEYCDITKDKTFDIKITKIQQISKEVFSTYFFVFLLYF